MTSKQTDLQDREARREWIAANLRAARVGTDRLRRLADQEAPPRDDDGDDS